MKIRVNYSNQVTGAVEADVYDVESEPSVHERHLIVPGRAMYAPGAWLMFRLEELP